MSDEPKQDGRTKPDDQKATSQIQLRVTPKRKSAYVREANRRKTTLANFIFTACDEAAGYQEPQER